MRHSCLFFSAALLGLSGCAFAPQLRRVAVNHNEIVANSNNELVLLNILRARDREPLHFTSVSKLVGDAQLQGTAGANIAIRGPTDTAKTNAVGGLVDTATVAGTEVTTPSAQFVVSGKSSMDVAVWDTQEFYQGITASVPASTLAHYLHQGWPSDLLSYVFISSVEFVARADANGIKKGQVIRTLVNDPDNPTVSPLFGQFVGCYRLDVVQKSKPDTPVVPLSRLTEVSLADLALLDGDKFDIDKPREVAGQPVDRWINRKGKTADSLVLRNVPQNSGGSEGCASAPSLQLMSPPEPEGGVQGGAADGHNIVARAPVLIDGKLVDADVQIVLRSVEGVIYFLGEYVRLDEPPYTVSTHVGRIPILRVIKRRPERLFVSTRYRGERYYVPANSEGKLEVVAGRSTQVFSLVQQLLNLQKSAKDRPTTQTVRVVE